MFSSPFRCVLLVPGLLLASVIAQPATGQTTADRTAYLTQIAELQRIGPELARQQGKQALIQRYQDLINAYPGQPDNIRLETQIGLIYESNLSDTGEPPNLPAAYATYQGIIQAYDPSLPYMREVRRMAADRAMQLDPKAAQDQFTSIIADYPDDDPLVVSSYYNLGRLAAQNGDLEAARAYYEKAVNHVAVNDALSEAQVKTMETYQANAALSLLAEVVQRQQDPTQRVAAVQAFLKDHPELARSQEDLVERLLKTVQSPASGGTVASPGANDAVKTLMKMLGDKQKTGISDRPSAQGTRQGGQAPNAPGRPVRMARENQPTENAGKRESSPMAGGSDVSGPADRGKNEATAGSASPVTPAGARTKAAWLIPAAIVLLAVLGVVVLRAAKRG